MTAAPWMTEHAERIPPRQHLVRRCVESIATEDGIVYDNVFMHGTNLHESIDNSTVVEFGPPADETFVFYGSESALHELIFAGLGGQTRGGCGQVAAFRDGEHMATRVLLVWPGDEREDDYLTRLDAFLSARNKPVGMVHLNLDPPSKRKAGAKQ